MGNISNTYHIHQEYILPKHFCYWKRGGYSTIYKFYDEIIKELPKFFKNNEINERVIHHTSITEIAISQFLPRHSSFIDCYHIYTNQENYYIYQDYKGPTLTEWILKTPLNKRIEELPLIIYQLVNILLFLENQGIYYTDLRPCNLLAPEVIFDSTVVSNSISWSIGMLICELLDDYPIQKKYYPSYKIKNNQEFWRNLLNNIYIQEQDPIAFKNSYLSIPEPWKKWILNMMLWDFDKRMSKLQLLQELSTTFQLSLKHISHTLNTNAYPYHRKNYRLKFLNKLYLFAYSIDELYKFCLTIYIWDLYTPHIHSKNEINTLCASWILTGTLLGQYAYESDTTLNLCKYFKTTYKKVYPYIWKIGEKCHWNIYQKSTDIYLFEHYKRIPWESFITFYSNYKQNYSTFHLSQAFIQSNPTI